MTPLPVNVRSLDWDAVRTYAEARLADLTAQAIDLAADDRTRLIASARIAELRQLLDAPAQTLIESERRHADKPRHSGGGY